MVRLVAPSHVEDLRGPSWSEVSPSHRRGEHQFVEKDRLAVNPAHKTTAALDTRRNRVRPTGVRTHHAGRPLAVRFRSP